MSTRHVKRTTDPGYCLGAGDVHRALGISRGGLYIRKDLMALARKRNGLIYWRPADLRPFVAAAKAAATFSHSNGT